MNWITDSLTFRSAISEDCPFVYEMICDMEAKTLPYSAFQSIFLQQIVSTEHDFVLAESSGAVVAFIHLRYENQLHHAGRIAEIMEFVVKDEYRNKGFGRELLAYAEHLAGNRSCVQIEVACNQLRRSTHRFYLREGMKNYHYKFSKILSGPVFDQNVLGR